MIAVFPLTALATLLALGVYFYAGLAVGRARGKYGVKAPAVTGDPAFERVFRAQQNTLEWLPLFLPALWLFASAWGDKWAALVGILWALARLAYVITYSAAANKRGGAFMAQFILFAIAWLGALVGVMKALVA
jgi:glutathione S-transferase